MMQQNQTKLSEVTSGILMSVLAPVGTAGVPGVGLIMLSMVFAQVGLPIEGIGLILVVYRILDILRTAVNVGGGDSHCGKIRG